ncbi:MAG: chemotaxis protein CheX [Phycisphaerales bacterium]|nr:chemotaxis protein CheX [Phycisphaerales bacterium]
MDRTRPQGVITPSQGVLKAFTGSDIDPRSPDFSDAVGELVNMISGAAKAKFDGMSVSISCPSVIIGPGHLVQQASDTTCIVIPFECSAGPFAVEVAMRKAESAISTKAA